jgi:hypothetical protein
VLNLLHYWEDEWFSIVISVSTNTKVDFLIILISFEVSGKRENWISGGLGNMTEVVASEFGLLGFELVVEKGKSFHCLAS